VYALENASSLLALMSIHSGTVEGGGIAYTPHHYIHVLAVDKMSIAEVANHHFFFLATFACD
jgi:hypothetical protein